MNSTWLMTPSSRLRPAMRKPARAASARACAVASESLVVSQAIERLLHFELDLQRHFFAACGGLARGGAGARALRARFAPPSKNCQLSTQRDHAEVAAAAELVFLALRAGIDAERQRGLQVRARELHAGFRGTRGAIELLELGPVVERRGRAAPPRSCTVRATSPSMVGGDQLVIERLIAQEVEVAARLGLAVARFAQLLHHREQLGAGAQHLVLRDLAVAEQGIVDAQVLFEQRDARLHDVDGLRGLQPVEIGDRHVALQPARERDAAELRGFEQRALRADRRGNRRRVQRLAQREARVLFALALELDRLIG